MEVMPHRTADNNSAEYYPGNRAQNPVVRLYRALVSHRHDAFWTIRPDGRLVREPLEPAQALHRGRAVEAS